MLLCCFALVFLVFLLQLGSDMSVLQVSMSVPEGVFPAMAVEQMERLDARAEQYGTREAWLMARRTGIGGSDAPVLFGEGYSGQSLVTLYESKVAEVVSEEDVKSLNDYLRIGKALEPGLRQIFTEFTGKKVVHFGDSCLFRHVSIPCMLASLDGLCWDDEIESWCPLELKNVSSFMGGDWGTDDDPQVPLKFQVQVQHQLEVLDLPRAYILGLVGGNKPRIRCIERNRDYAERALLPVCAEFWRHVESRTLPPIDGSDATAKALARLYPVDACSEVILPIEAETITQEIKAFEVQAKNLETEIDKRKNGLRAMLGEHEIGLLPGGGRWTWKEQTRKSYVVKESTYRVLRHSAK